MFSEERIRNVLYDVIFSQQGGVHDGNGPLKKMSALDMAYEITKKLRIRPVSIKPFFTVHWGGDGEVDFSHVKSHISGRRYELKTMMAVRTEGKKWHYVDGEQAAKDVVGNFERERGIGPT